MKSDFHRYMVWKKEQVCIDCGEKATGKKGLWATEIQCLECFAKLGCPENRGLLGARELANKAGIHV